MCIGRSEGRIIIGLTMGGCVGRLREATEMDDLLQIYTGVSRRLTYS